MIKLEIPFLSLEQICDSGQCFRMQKEACGNYSLIASGRYLRAGQRERQLFLYCSQEEYETVWKSYFDLDTDYGRFLSAVNQDDPYLLEAVRLRDSDSPSGYLGNDRIFFDFPAE